ncbi:MAG: DUF2344 domain-containing protein [Anaerolineales bacterium]|uniref:DUF2344 domain-containing protein n=1 Tax=Candidatus Desulfolinea nitratireducens TaxID=2841698 RepID=A0A8J6NKN4_9CHLR|nr:DUF2344 domain-containing protein [Candidatus Desulfolinea nitratireducens]MBL6960207.1 DUF2344 domain-containing protein [Anaerolineales bacterium]
MKNDQQPINKRLRISFSKEGPLRFIGHLDLHHIWQRSIRRAGLPLVYSQGFHPQPKIQLASALALGFSSRAEVVDIWIEENRIQTSDIGEKLQSAVPEGIAILDVQEVELGSPALQTQIVSSEYEVTLLDENPASLINEKLATLMEAESILRPKRVKHKKRKHFTSAPPTYDLRPLILKLVKLPPGKEDNAIRLFMHLSAREGATGRPDEVLAELGIPVEDVRVERTKLIFSE